MALAVAQTTAKVRLASATTAPITFTVTPTVGNAIIVPVIFFSGSGTATATDNQGNTYALAVLQTVAAQGASILYCSRIAAASGTFTITVSLGTSGYAEMCGIEVSGVGGGLVLDQTTKATAAGAAPSPGATAALTADAVLLTAAVSMNITQTAITVESVSPAWTQAFENLDYSASIAGEADTRTRTGVLGTTQTCTWAITSATYCAVLAAFAGTAVPPVVAPTLTDALNLRGTIDENGALRAVVDTTGTIAGPLTNFGNLRVRTDATGALVVASGTAGALSTPPTVFPNLRGRTNDAGALMVAATSAGAVQGPLTALGNLRLRTDENGALKVAPSAAGSVIGPLTPLANLRVRTDENGALLMSGLVAETYSSRVLADGAFAYWRFVETTGPVIDSTDSLNGTINGTVTRGVAGAILSAPTDFAISVAGAGRIDLPVMTLPAICSVEAWVKTPLSSGFHFIWTNRNATVSTNPTFLMENGQPQFAMNGITVAPSAVRIDDGLWHHVVGTASGTDLSMYVDGVFYRTIAAVTTASAAQPGVIGWDNFGGFATLTIDNLALYPIALTATQVTNHYHLAGY